MKKFSPLRFITSLLLIAFVSLFVASIANPTPVFALKVSVTLLVIGAAWGRIKSQYTGVLGDFVISDTTYAGEAASQFILKAITGADTVDSGSVYIKDGIKKKFTIPRWDADYTDLIQDRQATPTSKGTMTVDGQALNPADYMIYMEFNPRDFEDHWFATQLNPTLIDRSLPNSAESVVVQGVLARHAKYLNKLMWMGDTTTTGIYKYFEGFLRKMTLSSDTITQTATTLSATNIAAELQKGYDKIPIALRYDPAMKFYCSYATYDLWAKYQTDTQTYKGVDITQQGVPKFRGKDVVKIADFPDNQYVIAKGMATTESNLWLGMNSMSDEGLKLSPLQNNSELWFVKMNMKVDVQIGWNGEVVYYS